MIDLFSVLKRAEIHIEQHRPDYAEKVLATVAAICIDNPLYWYLKARIALLKNDLAGGMHCINNAIQLSPDDPDLGILLAHIHLLQNQDKQAEEVLRNYIGIHPNYAGLWSILAGIQLNQKAFEEALASAETALTLDANNLMAINMRSMALNKLKRVDEAVDAMKDALGRNPDSYYTYSTNGWNALELGRHKEALDYFKSALKLNPHFNPARQGMIEALKAQYALYRWFLQFRFWMANKKFVVQIGIIAGIYFGGRVLNFISESQPQLAFITYPLLALYFVFILSTWVMKPLSNVFLRFNPYGKYLLEPQEVLSSNLCAISLLIGLIGLGVFLFTLKWTWGVLALSGVILMIPFSAMFEPAHKFKRNILIISTLLLSVLAISGNVLSFVTGKSDNLLVTLFMSGVLIFQLLYMFLR